MAEIPAIVLYNESRPFTQRAVPTDTYSVTAFTTAPYDGNPHETAERLWAAFNRGSGSEHPEMMTAPVRSMSVGDVVVLDTPDHGPVALVAAAFGWENLP
jgi:hypothetical protein